MTEAERYRSISQTGYHRPALRFFKRVNKATPYYAAAALVPFIALLLVVPLHTILQRCMAAAWVLLLYGAIRSILRLKHRLRTREKEGKSLE